MAYKIVEAGTVEDLTKYVNEAIEKGWRLQGGVVITPNSEQVYWYAQAMVRGVKWTLEMD
tara:strand:- start:66 stop:245 length:180 start_codon:yes stop_codon:yes gene_type:complete